MAFHQRRGRGRWASVRRARRAAPDGVCCVVRVSCGRREWPCASDRECWSSPASLAPRSIEFFEISRMLW